jgi:hypothetical protein
VEYSYHEYIRPTRQELAESQNAVARKIKEIEEANEQEEETQHAD